MAALASALERLEQLGIEASRNELDDIGLRQLFIRDPNGLMIELNFREGPA